MKRFSLAKTNLRWVALCIVVAIFSGYAHSQSGVLLSCELEGGYPDNQIYINEAEGYILYNAQHRESYERQRVYESDSGEPLELDDGMEITVNNAAFILATDVTSSFVFIKDTATFAYAWTMPVPLGDAKFLAFGNHHEGKCSINPFSQPDE